MTHLTLSWHLKYNAKSFQKATLIAYFSSVKQISCSRHTGIAVSSLRALDTDTDWHLTASWHIFVWHLHWVFYWSSIYTLLIFSPPRGHKLSDCLADIWRGLSSWYLTFLPTGPSWLPTAAWPWYTSSMNWTLKYSTPSWQRWDFIRHIKHAGAKLIVSFERKSKCRMGSTPGHMEVLVEVNYWSGKLFDVVLWGPTAGNVCQLKAFMLSSDVAWLLIASAMDSGSKHLEIDVCTSLLLLTWEETVDGETGILSIFRLSPPNPIDVGSIHPSVGSQDDFQDVVHDLQALCGLLLDTYGTSRIDGICATNPFLGSCFVFRA